LVTLKNILEVLDNVLISTQCQSLKNEEAINPFLLQQKQRHLQGCQTVYVFSNQKSQLGYTLEVFAMDYACIF
jgi:hypothetical protein